MSGLVVCDGPRRYDRDVLEMARVELCRVDAGLRGIVGVVGPCVLPTRSRMDHLTALIRSIVFQQLSGKAASTIFGRVMGLVVSRAQASDYLAVSDEAYRAAGLSRQKIGYLRDLCAKVADGTLRLSRIGGLADEDVERALTQVRGFGRWSAHMFLLFQLRRCDVWPMDDLGIRKALQLVDGREELPKVKEVALRGDVWRPYRSVASWYLWRSLEAGIPSDFV